MSDLIRRDEVIGILHYNSDESCSSIVADVEAAPTVDAVEVVRCKDCAYFMKDIKPIPEGAAGICYLRMIHGQYSQYCGCHGNDFCSYGEREQERTK